jgi:23S rRNA (uracil1939-C5)-methyltransferase
MGSKGLTPSMEIVLTAEKPAAGGRMLARHEGQVVFVAGAIPGERVKARVDRVTRQLAFAEVVDVLEPSPDRRASAVDIACGGSVYAHIAYARQLTLKSELLTDAFARIAKLNLGTPTPVMASREDGYRLRARLHIRNGRFGFFREGTHDLCDAAATAQLLPDSLDALKRLQAKVPEFNSAFSCELLENIPADERAIQIEFAQSPAVIHGGPKVTDRLAIAGGSVTLTHDVRSFFQSNRYLLAAFAERVVAQIPDGGVIDLYAGVGLFAVSLAALGRAGIVAIEGDRYSAADLESNARPYGDAVSVRRASVEEYLGLSSVRSPSTIVMDPPRTGISTEAMSGILALKPHRAVYVSCDVATLARDARRLVEAGYQLTHLEAFDLFPNTAHVETLAVFSRLGT